MAELLENSLLNVLSCLEQVDKDRLWADTHDKVNKLAKAVLLALDHLTDENIEHEGYMTAIHDARKSLQEAC